MGACSNWGIDVRRAHARRNNCPMIWFTHRHHGIHAVTDARLFCGQMTYSAIGASIAVINKYNRIELGRCVFINRRYELISFRVQPVKYQRRLLLYTYCIRIAINLVRGYLATNDRTTNLNTGQCKLKFVARTIFGCFNVRQIYPLYSRKNL